jgi:hypothetical protein
MSLELEKRLGEIFIVVGLLTIIIGVLVFPTLLPKWGTNDLQIAIASITLTTFAVVGVVITFIGSIMFIDSYQRSKISISNSDTPLS